MVDVPSIPGYIVVYKATNKKNGKSYIGLSKDFNYRRSRHILDSRRGSQLHFHRALRKYGEDSFEWCIIYECSSLYLASSTEQLLIKHYNTYKNGYNMTTGGESRWTKVTSEETKRRLSVLYKGKTYEEIHGTEKATAIKQKQSKAHKGRVFTNEHKRKMSEANKRRWKEGNIGRKGKPCIVFGKQFRNGKDAATELGISEPTLRKWIKLGKNGARYL